MANRTQTRAIGIYPAGDSSKIDLSVTAFVPGDVSHGVRTACLQVPTLFVSNISSLIAEVEIPLAIWAHGYGVQAVVMVLSIKSGQQYLASVYVFVIYQVAILVGVDDRVSRTNVWDLSAWPSWSVS